MKTCRVCGKDTVQHSESMGSGFLEESESSCSNCGFREEFSYGAYLLLIPFPDYTVEFTWSYTTQSQIDVDIENLIAKAKYAWEVKEIKNE